MFVFLPRQEAIFLREMALEVLSDPSISLPPNSFFMASKFCRQCRYSWHVLSRTRVVLSTTSSSANSEARGNFYSCGFLFWSSSISVTVIFYLQILSVD